MTFNREKEAAIIVEIKGYELVDCSLFLLVALLFARI